MIPTHSRGPDPLPSSGWDVIVIGSGFGGAMAALPLVDAGLRVLVLERGPWVERGEHNRAWEVAWEDRPAYSKETPYRVEGESSKDEGAFHCVGGPSVYYGGVALRMREEDFAGHPDVTGDVRWPLDYRHLRPWYDLAERLLEISGDDGPDPTAPPRDRPLPPPGLALSRTSEATADAARRLGLHPFRLPLAVNDAPPGPANERPRCTACGVCDGFACYLGAKNDLAMTVLPDLLARGLTLRPDTVVRRLVVDGDRVVAADAVDRGGGERLRFEAERFVLAAGALATPHLLLASELQRRSPAEDAVGRYLVRHCNGIVLGAAPSSIGDPDDFRKQLGIHDYYFGGPEAPELGGKAGGIQSIRATRIALAMAPLPVSVKKALHPPLSRLVGFIVMAEDQPVPENRVYLDPSATDRFDRPVARVHHRHTPRDVRARAFLYEKAAGVLREAGSAFTLTVPIKTFSHALGTVRMGEDESRFPLAPDGRYRGVGNLFISDGSTFPTAGAVNPSLTIAANALRIGAGMVGRSAPGEGLGAAAGVAGPGEDGR